MIGTILGQNGCLRPTLAENDVLADEQMAVARAAAMVDEISAAVTLMTKTQYQIKVLGVG